MAVEEDDGMVERILPVAGTGDLTQFIRPATRPRSDVRG